MLGQLIGCPYCGVVLNAEVVFAGGVLADHDTGVIDTEYAEWDGEDYIPKRDCPVCDQPVVLPRRS